VQAAAVYALEDVIAAAPERRVAIVQTLVALITEHRVASGTAAEAEAAVREIALSGPVVAAQVVIARHKQTLGAPPTVLGGADLRSFDLAGADLRSANLRGADLRFASLEGAKLSDTDARGANMANVILRDANLMDADLSGARLHDAKLERAILMIANLADASLVRADLSDADLRVVDLRGADLRSANLSRAMLHGADLRGADLRNASLHGAEVAEVRSWIGARVAGVTGMPSGWCPEGAVLAPDDPGGPSGPGSDAT
jgi:uncharacterized protein YjbI with pentapeptide repeats